MKIQFKIAAVLGILVTGLFLLPKAKAADVPTDPTMPSTPSTPSNPKKVTPTPVKVVEPIQKPATGSLVYWNSKSDASQISLYKSISDYARVPYLTLPIGKKSRVGIKYLGWQGYIYNNSTVTAELYIIQLPGVSVPLYVASNFLSTNPNA